MQTPLAEVLFQHVRQYNAKRVLLLGAGSGLNALYLARALKTCDGSLTVIDDPPTEGPRNAIREYDIEYDGDLAHMTINEPYDSSVRGMIRRGEHFDMVVIDYRRNQSWYKVALSLTVANAVLQHKGWVVFTGHERDVPVEHAWNTLLLTDSRYWNHIHVADLAMAQRDDT